MHLCAHSLSDQYVYTVIHYSVSIHLCPCHQQLGLFLSGWCITDSRKGRKTKEECPRDKREEEEDSREDTERRENIPERHLLVSLLLLLILQRSDCGADMNYTSNHVTLGWEVCEHFSGWLNLQKWAINPIDRYWRRDWVRMKYHNILLQRCHHNVPHIISAVVLFWSKFLSVCAPSVLLP